MKDGELDLCGAESGGRAPDMPYLAAEDSFAFQCAGCGLWRARPQRTS